MIAQSQRPRKFSEVVGHKANLEAFKAKAKDFDYPEVIILAGLSGSGKSTCANIIASTINCSDPQMNDQGYHDPCGKCPSCLSVINETFSHDIHYYTGTSLEKEGVLGLEEDASMSPWHGGRKTIVLVDEFQDLKERAKSATLQLLEKKRKDTVFILCTMDMSSIDKSISSRGQVYTFKPLSASDIYKILVDTLQAVDPEEKIPMEPEALILLSQNSWGSARQAQSYLERCIDSKLYTVEQIEQELNFLSEVKGYEIFNKLIAKDTSFYQELKNVTPADFYIYSWSILSTLNKTLLTVDPDDWKYKSSKAILDSPNYEALAQAYLNINRDTNGWFKGHIFDYYIGKYMMKEPTIRTRVKKE